MNIETLQEKIKHGRYSISFTHTEKLRQRRIKAENIEQAIATGLLIEGYPEDRRGLSCLILGFAGKRPLPVVCGCLDAEEVLIITAYEPDAGEWEGDWKTCKRK